MTERQISDFLLPHEASRVLGLTPQSIRRLFDQGALAGVRGPGGHRLVSKESVQRLARERSGRAATLLRDTRKGSHDETE